jgi:hypothetical protein
MFSNVGEKEKKSTDLTSVGKVFQMVGAATQKPWLEIDSFQRGTSNKNRSEDER